MSSRAKLTRIVLVLLSLVLWTTWELRRDCRHPYHDLTCGRFTDHFSHMNAARVFPRAGADVWRRSYKSMFRQLAPEELDRVPQGAAIAQGAELYEVPGWNTNKPLAASWSHNPRLYPPGDMLLVAPVALLYHFTGLSFEHASVMLLILFLAYAHVAIYAVFSVNWPKIPLLATALLYFEIVHWTLEGFYDATAIVPLLVCVWYLEKRRGLAASLAFCIAVFIHFRALFFLPWGVYAAYLLIRNREWQTWRLAHYIAVAAAVLMGIASAIPFLLLWPTMQKLPNVNPISFRLDHPDGAVLASCALVVLMAVAAFLWSKAWLDLAMLGWFCVMVLSLRETYLWHLLLPLGWLVAPIVRVKAAESHERLAWVVYDARILVVLCTGALVFKANPLPTWLVQVF